MRSSLFALAFAGAGAMAVDPTAVSADQAKTILSNVIDSLQAAGDLRVKLQQATPKVDGQNAAPLYKSLTDSFNHTFDLLPNRNGDVNIGTATAAQAAAICALVPKLLAAGTHASDTLINLPDFQEENGVARDAAIKLGGVLESLGWSLNLFHWGFINAGVAGQCDKGAQNDFFTVPNQLMDAGTAILY